MDSHPDSSEVIAFASQQPLRKAGSMPESVMSPSQVREQLASLERIVQTLLRQASEVGAVFIITNASEGWVQHSSSLCMPGLQEDLAKVDILSARGAFEASFPGDSHAWKMHAFLQVQNKLQLEAVTNLVSVGDSHIEMDAVHLLGRSFAHALVKTVKLWERPVRSSTLGRRGRFRFATTATATPHSLLFVVADPLRAAEAAGGGC